MCITMRSVAAAVGDASVYFGMEVIGMGSIWGRCAVRMCVVVRVEVVVVVVGASGRNYGCPMHGRHWQRILACKEISSGYVTGQNRKVHGLKKDGLQSAVSTTS